MTLTFGLYIVGCIVVGYIVLALKRAMRRF